MAIVYSLMSMAVIQSQGGGETYTKVQTGPDQVFGQNHVIFGQNHLVG